MRVLQVFFCCCLLSVLVGSCKKEDSPSTEDRLVGTWDTDFAASDANGNFILEEKEKSYFPSSSHLLYSFNSNGTLMISESTGAPDKYSWSVSSSGTTIRLVPENDTTARKYYRVHTLTSNGLILQDTLSSGTLNWTGMIKL